MGETKQSQRSIRAFERWTQSNKHICETAVRLYCEEGLGLKAIRKVTGVTSTSTVRRLLIHKGVYKGDSRNEITLTDSEVNSRAKYEIEKRKKFRSSLALCLRELRRGIPIAVTCKKHGFVKTTVLNALNKREVYRAWRASRINHTGRPQRDYKNRWVSVRFPQERKFQDHVSKVLASQGIPHLQEYQIPGLMSRADFCVRNFLIECKVDVRTGSMNEGLGQLTIYKLYTDKERVLLLPDDVVPRQEHLNAMAWLGARVLYLRHFQEFLDEIRGGRSAGSHGENIPEESRQAR